MRFGMCTNFASSESNKIDYALLEQIYTAGFDFVEFPMTQIITLEEWEFEKLCQYLELHNIDCDCCCNLFPGDIRIVGSDVDKIKIRKYLEKAFERASRMNVKKLVLGSWRSRNLSSSQLESENGILRGYTQFCELLEEDVLPFCRKYGIIIVVEPICFQLANFLITLKDGLYVVNRINKPEIKLLADIMHMNHNEESPKELKEVMKEVRHIHLCERDRILPEEKYSSYLKECMLVIKDSKYDETISLEAKAGKDEKSIKRALGLLKTELKQ